MWKALGSKNAAQIFGGIVATIFGLWLTTFLNGLSKTWDLLPFLGLCAIICAGCLILARQMDKKAQARQSRAKSDRP